MKVALVSSGYENLGVEYLSAALKKDGHEVRFFFDPQTFGGGIFLRIDALNRRSRVGDRIVEQIATWRPDIVGFSCMTHNYRWSLGIARRVKRRLAAPVIFGGIHPTSIPATVLANDCVDMVAIGESEESFCRLLGDLPANMGRADIAGIHFKRGDRIVANPPAPLPARLDDLALPDKEMYFAKMPAFRRIDYSIMASRGCPYSCSYCCNDILKGLYESAIRRTRSVESVIAELRHAKQRYGVPRVFFYDEVFPFNRRWLEEFAARYKSEIGLPFKIYFHFKLADDRRVGLLREAGCDYIIFGMQSASERIRADVCNRHYTNDEVRRAVAVCKAHGIQIEIDHILGLPFETDREYGEAVDFYRELRPDVIYSYWLTYYPGTSIVALARKAGLLPEDAEQRINEGAESFYHKGTFVADRRKLLVYELLFDLVPLLPRRLHARVSGWKRLLRVAPKGYLVHFTLLLLASLRLRRNLFANNLRLTFSRKHVP